MPELSSKYNPSEIESKWYAYWEDNQLFASHPDGRQPYTVVIPPPNVTGVLHMGHVLNETIQDILVRKARLDGKNACWVPGTDHASIATEAKVVKRLAEQGIRKSDLSREDFLRHAWAWKEEYGGMILRQLRALGASCDWSRTAFTMDEERSRSVIHVFCDLHQKGLIYRGVRMVNWDPKAQTALSDEEVIYKEEHSKLYYLKYRLAPSTPFSGSGEDDATHQDAQGYYAIVATTRPETIMGDTAVCINPDDPKNHWLRGKRLIVPLVNREVPVIEDDYVDIQFGTGCLKVTPAHDVNDYMLGDKHHLPSIDILNNDGTLSKAAGLYVGMDRFDVRRQIETDLCEAGLMERVEDYTNKVGCSERTGVPIEPKLSMQWFLSMQHFADIALPPVMNDDIAFHPAKYKTTYHNWLTTIKDWCISRQLWWGHRIPAYYLPDGDGYVVAETPEEALRLAQEKSGNKSLTADDLRQDEDVLDTWFSSWLWPLSLFNGITEPDNPEIRYYYPTATLVTGPDILFFWVARMIMAGYEYTAQPPFRHVYFTGIVRDKLGRKMSKQLGNSPDPLQLIEQYGADGVRMGMLLCAPAGNDILFDEALCHNGQAFCNKIWNAFRLVQGWQVSPAPQPPLNCQAVQWFGAQLRAGIAQIEDLYGKYRLSEALMAAYKLFTDEFSGWYLEMVKPAYQQPVDPDTLQETLQFFETLMKVIHPFMPFITEEIWQQISPRSQGDSIMRQRLDKPSLTEGDMQLLADVERAKQVVSAVRGIRNAKNISPREPLDLQIVQRDPCAAYHTLIQKMAGVRDIVVVEHKADGASSFMVGTTEFAVPLGSLIDKDAERAKVEADLRYQEGFLAQVLKKLSNERFVANAPAKVVETERKKQHDAQTKINALKATLASLQ